MAGRKWTDEEVELIIGRLLRAGVTLAAGVVALGGAWYLARYGVGPVNYAAFRGEPSDLRNVPDILAGVFSLHSRSLIQFGLLLLIATPVARVAFSVAAFALQGDRKYVLITLIVLVILLYSLAGGG